MPRFFKRSAKVPITNCQSNDNDNHESCAIDTYRIRSDDQPILQIANQNRSIEIESNAEQQKGSTTSVSERVSHFVNGIIGIMGKNRRKSKLNQQLQQQQQQQQQQSQQQSHLKKVNFQSDKQPQNGKIQRQSPSNKKVHHTELFSSNETPTIETNKSFGLVSFETNIKSERSLNGGGGSGSGSGGSSPNEKQQRKFLLDGKNNSIKQPQSNTPICPSDTFNTNNAERVIFIDKNASHQMKCATKCIDTNAIDSQATAKRNQMNANQLKNNSNKGNNGSGGGGGGVGGVNSRTNINILSSTNDRINKNSSSVEATAATAAASQQSCIKIDRRSSRKDQQDNPNCIECKQTAPHQNNNHISSSTDANNNKNEVNSSQIEKVNDVIVNVDVTRKLDKNSTDSKQQHLAVIRDKQQSSKKSTPIVCNSSIPNTSCIENQNSSQEATNVKVTCDSNSTTHEATTASSSTATTTTMGQFQSTNNADKSNEKQQNNENYTKCANGPIEKQIDTTETIDEISNVWHDAAAAASPPPPPAAAAAERAQAPFYDKNKINFSNEINEILESETSSKQSYESQQQQQQQQQQQPGAEAHSEIASNEIKDVFYETTSEFHDEITATEFASNGKSVNIPQYTGTVTKNVPSCTIRSHTPHDTYSIGTENDNSSGIDTKILLKNDPIDVNSATHRSDTIETAEAKTTAAPKSAEREGEEAKASITSVLSVPSDQNDSLRDVEHLRENSTFAGEIGEQIGECETEYAAAAGCDGDGDGDGEGDGDGDSGVDVDTKSVAGNQSVGNSSNLKKTCDDESVPMEQNVLYRVDSCTSDDPLDLSDIEETVIDQNGKVIEVKTVFRRSSTRTPPPNEHNKFRKSATTDISSDFGGFRTIHGRRRSNSITGSLGIEIVEVDLSTNRDNTEYLTQQPFVSFVDDTNAIKLSDLRDNTKETEKNNVSNAIDIIEIVEEDSNSSSEYEEIEEEIEDEESEEIEDEEEEEDEEEDDDLVTASTDSVEQSPKLNNNAFKLKSNGECVEDSQQTPHKATSAVPLQQRQTNHLQNGDSSSSSSSTDNDDVIRVLINGQPARFNANTLNLSNNKITEPISHSHSNVNQQPEVKNKISGSSNNDRSSTISNIDKFTNNCSDSNKSSSSNATASAYDKSQFDAMKQPKQQQLHPQTFSDDAMHLPDIVVGSTLHASNINNNNSLGCRKPIPLSRSPPRIIVNDNTLDSWSSNDDETTGSLEDSFDDSTEVDEDASESTDDGAAAKKAPNEKLLSSNKMNVCNKTESQTNILAEAKQRELSLLAQLAEAQGKVDGCQAKIADLTYKISELERDSTLKSWNIERLQAELEAAYKELDCVKNKLRLQETELEMLRLKHSDKEDDYNLRYNNLQADHLELKQKLDQMQSLAISLQVQLSTSQSDLTDLRAEKQRLISEKKECDVERQALQDALDAAIIERAENDAKWQRDFEQLRTLNSDREELLLQDCEWKIRETEKACKDRIIAAEQLKQEAIRRAENVAAESQTQIEQIQHLKACEAELAALRGLTNEQRESIAILTQQLEEMKMKLDESTSQLEETTRTMRKMAAKFASDLSDKDREMIARIDEVRGDVAAMWEERLLNEMLRLKIELETCFAEDRMEAVQKAQREHLDDVAQLKETFSFREKMLQDELEAIREKLADRNRRLDEANEKADKQIMQIRMILNKSEQGHQREFNSQASQHEQEIDRLKEKFTEKESELRAHFESKIEEIKRKCSDEVNRSHSEVKAKLKKEYELQYEKFKADKEEEQQDLQRNYKRQMTNAEDRMRDVEILHQREIKDLQNAHSMERSSLEQRDLQNSQEIETLHRKCRCLTQLFDEMRIRYERREPRAEDIREIQELKSVIEAQDKDLRLLTEKLREFQMHRNAITPCEPPPNYERNEMMMMHEQQQQQQQPPLSPSSMMRKMKKPSLNCDVIYEAENEEEEEAAEMAPKSAKAQFLTA